jgi:hypothetical protein
MLYLELHSTYCSGKKTQLLTYPLYQLWKSGLVLVRFRMTDGKRHPRWNYREGPVVVTLLRRGSDLENVPEISAALGGELSEL